MTLAELLALLLSGDLSGLTDEDLGAHEATLLGEFDERRPNARTPEDAAELNQIAEAVDAVRTEAGTRIDAAVALQEEIDAIASRMQGPDPEPEPEPEPEAPAEPDPAPEVQTEAAPAPAADPAPVVTEERVPVLAGAGVPARTRPRLASLGSLPSDAAPANAPRNTLTIAGRPQNAARPTTRDIAEAFIEADRSIGMAAFAMNHRVLNVHGEYPEGRMLTQGNDAGNDALVSALIGPEALTAGVVCGPATPYYQLAEISDASRPVHDFVSSFGVTERGAMQFNRPFALSDFSDAVGEWTDADNEDAEAQKACTTIDCTATVSAEVQAFTRCLTINNFQARYSPEHVAQAVQKTLVNWAILSEQYLLNQIKAASVAVDVNVSVLGAIADFLYTLGVASESYRNSDRMAEGAVLDALIPRWFVKMAAGDMVRTSHQYREMLEFTRAELEAGARNLGVRLGYYVDTPTTGVSQKFAAQGVGDLVDYPDRMQWGLWHNGAHVSLDGGPDLNFGLVRDPDTIRTNTYMTFGENFEGYAFLGVKSWWLTQTICPSGTYAAPVDIQADVCGGTDVPGS